MSKKHEDGCTCPICNNVIREERQYAALQVKDDKFVILDVEEYVHFDKFMKNINNRERLKQPSYKLIEPEDDKALVLAYGALIPQYAFNLEDWNKELEKYKEFAFGTLENNSLYLSVYKDFQLIQENKIYNTHIPCALLLDTALNLSEKKEYGFGYTSFLIYQNMEIFDNIFNREFMFSLGDLESNFKADDIENWKNYIDKEKLISIAEHLF